MAEPSLFRDPFFWASLSLAAGGAGNAIVSNVLPRSQLLGLIVVSTFMLGRTLLVLPFCPQPRFELAGLHFPLGATLMLAGISFVLPVLRVQWRTGPDASEELRTTGAYGIVRHPGYLGNILLGLGWSIVFRSSIGVALTLLWWLGFHFHALIEEASLERAYGDAYRDYEKRVSSRLIPLPRFRSGADSRRSPDQAASVLGIK